MHRDKTKEEPSAEAAGGTPMGRRTVLPLLAAVAAAVLVARRADGTSVLPGPIEAMLLLPVFVLWVRERFSEAALRGGFADRLLALVVAVVGLGIAFSTHDVLAPFRATALLVVGCMAVDRLCRLYGVLQADIEHAWRLIRRMAMPWLGLIALAAVLLALPIATRSSIPDYQHNFWLHVVNSLQTAAGAASLTGFSAYGFGEDYTAFGQAVIVVVMQLSGIAMAMIGLAIARPFLRRVPTVRTVLAFYAVLQAAAVALMYGAWRAEDAAGVVDRLWWGVVYATSAGCNGGVTMQAGGLAGYVDSSAVFACVTMLSMIGSLGAPIILDLILARRDSARTPWQLLPGGELIAVFVIVVGSAILIFLWETPWRSEIVWRLPEHWVPARPVDLGESRASLRDQMEMPQRWHLSVLTACTMRSAGMQSVPVSQGAISWPTFGLFLLSMGAGGSLAGVAGGMRVSVLLLLLICMFTRRRSWAVFQDGVRLRRRLMTALMLFVLGWSAFNVLVVVALGTLTQGSAYELAFDGAAAVNNCGFSTGLAVHLTQAGRLGMIAAMLLGRALPIVFWAMTADRLSKAMRDAGRPVARAVNT